MKKLLLKLLGDDIYQPEPIDLQKMQDWLFKSHQDQGFKNYYTMRKKAIVNLLLMDLSDKERDVARGRLEELKALSIRINDEYRRRKEKVSKVSKD